MAPVGRWQKGKDLFWYAREKSGGDAAEALAAERAAIKAQEQQAIEEALGLRPKAARAAGGMSQQELDAALRQQQHEDGAGGGGAGDPDRAQGLGFRQG
jgi:hypothetical protein